MKKTCIDCMQRLDVSAFYRVHKGSEHRQSRCKRCDNKRRAGGNFTARRKVLGPVETVRLADGSVVNVRKVLCHRCRRTPETCTCCPF